MQTVKSFGRRRPAEPPSRANIRPLETPAPSRNDDLPVRSAPEPGPVEDELKQWKPPQKSRVRVLAEPWRSMTIAASLGFGVSSWVLPDAVQDVVQITLGILMAGGLIAGRRKSKRLALESAGETEPIAR
jgi:hypothetical protein